MTERHSSAPTPEARELMRAVRGMVMALRRSGAPPWVADLRSGRVSPRHMPVLLEVAVDGPHSVSVLAARLGVSLPAASLMVAELAEAGLVTRSADPGDRRRTLVGLAPDRAGTIRTWMRERAALVQGIVDELTPDERRGLVRGLGLIAERLGGGEDAACAPGVAGAAADMFPGGPDR